MTDNKSSEKNKTGKPREVPKDIREKQDPDFDDGDLLDAIDLVSQRLERPSEPDRGTAKT